MQCIWCLNNANSGEHAWSDKLGEQLDKLLAKYNITQSYTAVSQSPFAPVHKAKWRNGPMHRLKVKTVCASCNNGWMNRHDERVRDLVVEMMNGGSASLGQREIIDLASWLTMKIMVLEMQNAPTAAFTKSEWVNFYLTGIPPAGLQIYLGHTKDARWYTAFNRQPERPAGASRAVAFTATWGIGQMVVFYEYVPVGGRPHRPPIGNVVRLWPAVKNITWQPPLSMTAEAIDRLATRAAPWFSGPAGDALTYSGKPKGRPV